MGELAHKLKTETLKLVLLNEFVEVHRKELESDADMIPEDETVQHVHDVVRIVLVLFFQVLQDTDFLLSLSVEPLLISDHFQGDVLVGFVIVGFDDLAERAFSDLFQDFVPIADVVMSHVEIRAFIIVEAAIIGPSDDSVSLLSIGADEVDLGIIEDFVMLVRRQFMHELLHRHFRRHGRRHSSAAAAGTVSSSSRSASGGMIFKRRNGGGSRGSSASAGSLTRHRRRRGGSRVGNDPAQRSASAAAGAVKRVMRTAAAAAAG